MSTEEIVQSLIQWRKVKKNNREPIPKEIWDAAVSLAFETSYTKVASETGLSTSDLKIKMGLPVTSRKYHNKKTIISRPKLKEMKIVQSIPTAIFELQTESGLKLKVFR